MRFSIITPVFDPPAAALSAMLASVRAQRGYDDWEHCLVDDGSSDPQVRRVLDRAASRDSRVKVAHRSEQGGIVAASNDALELATGEFVAFLDHDDLLHPRALQAMAAAISLHPEADFLYSDEDKVDERGNHFAPFLKPDWSPARLQCQMYTAHLGVMRLSLVKEVGGLREGFDGSQDWDLALRVGERARSVVHVPEILYSWRAVPGSAAAEIDAKPWAFDTAKKAVSEHLERTGVPAEIEDHPELVGRYRLRPKLTEHPLVSIVIPTAGGRRRVQGRSLCLVTNTVRSIVERSSYPNYEIVVVKDADTPATTVAELEGIGGERLSFVDYDGEFNFSVKVNLGAERARGEYLLLLNDDIEVMAAGQAGSNDLAAAWIESMLLYAAQPDVGSVGAKLLFSDGRIQHLGISMVEGDPAHPYYGFPGDYPGYFENGVLPAEYIAATAACLMVRREVFERVGGFSLGYPVNFGDVDFGLKLHACGYRTVVTPNATLHHYEHSSRPGTVEYDELYRMYDDWESIRHRDPYYHPSFGESRNFMPPPYLRKGEFWHELAE